jgi:hypothetical protein
MRKKVNGSALLVIVELDAEWPGLMNADATARRVVAQTEGESPTALAERVAGSLEGMFGRGIDLSSVALACNERLDDGASAARRKLAGLTLGLMAKHGSGRLCLSASARASGKLHHALSALAQDLSSEWSSAGLEVTVEFGEESRSSVSAAPAPAPAARVA